MDYARNYERTMHSIKTEEKARFRMSYTFTPRDDVYFGMDLEQQEDWMCGSTGCMIGHAIIANTENAEAHQILMREHSEKERATRLLRLSPAAAEELFMKGLNGPKKNAHFTLAILQGLKTIAMEREVTVEDVEHITAKTTQDERTERTRQRKTSL